MCKANTFTPTLCPAPLNYEALAFLASLNVPCRKQCHTQSLWNSALDLALGGWGGSYLLSGLSQNLCGPLSPYRVGPSPLAPAESTPSRSVLAASAPDHILLWLIAWWRAELPMRGKGRGLMLPLTLAAIDRAGRGRAASHHPVQSGWMWLHGELALLAPG